MKWKVCFYRSFLFPPGYWIACPPAPANGVAFDTWREAYDYAAANGEVGSP